MDEMCIVCCMACGTRIRVKTAVVSKIANPIIFCRTCDKICDPIFKRLIVQVSWIGQTVSQHHDFLRSAQ